MAKNLAKFIIITFFLFIIYSCAPTIKYTAINPSTTPKPATYPIKVYDQGIELPANSILLGTINTGDTGLSTDCTYNAVINYIKKKVRSVGGDAIFIIDVRAPDLSSTCYRITAAAVAFKDISGWLTLKMTEEEAKNYYDSNIGDLNQIEAIWNVNEAGTWRNVYNGSTGIIDQSNTYRIAIIKDPSNSNYEFVAIVLESIYPEWKPGFIKARFRKTAYSSIYEGLWYMKNFTEERHNFVIDESGLIKSKYAQTAIGIETSIESTLIKAYPPLFKESIPEPKLAIKEESSGSGFLLSRNGIVVTNYHVVRNAKKIEVIFPSKNLSKEASLKIRDLNNDIAILELQNFNIDELSKETIPYAFTDIRSIKIGQEVFTLGFPLGSIMGTNARFSMGRINSLFGLQDDPRLLQISNPLQPGNSGGPLFNQKGELVGIVVSGLNAKILYENFGIIPQNVNFAIKVSFLKNLIAMLPKSMEIISRKSMLDGLTLEDQIEKLNPFIVQIKAY